MCQKPNFGFKLNNAKMALEALDRPYVDAKKSTTCEIKNRLWECPT